MLRSLMLYTALVLGANTALAAEVDIEAAKSSGAAGLEKLTAVSGEQIPEFEMEDADGNMINIRDYEGQALLVNFWATWCVPCREEMPALEALQEAQGGDDFQVVTVATGRETVAKVSKFFDEENIDDLPILFSSLRSASRSGIPGLPGTLLVDRDGQIVARMIGDAEWDAPAAQKLIEDLKAE